MFESRFLSGLRTRSRTTAFSRLTVEQLESRDCPSTVTLNAQVLEDHQVRLTGLVTDGGVGVANVQVQFSGAAGGSIVSAADGSFSYTTSNAELGVAHAVGYVGGQAVTNTADANISVTAPSLAASISGVNQNLVTISGHVDDLDADELVVVFSGIGSAQITPDENGDFMITLEASGLGDLEASVVDLWGQAADPVELEVNSDAPVISEFAAVNEMFTIWTFRGFVSDESAAGMTVRLGGLPSLDGVTATVGSDGWWEVTRTLNAGETGTVTAITTDWWGLDSNLAMTSVS